MVNMKQMGSAFYLVNSILKLCQPVSHVPFYRKVLMLTFGADEADKNGGSTSANQSSDSSAFNNSFKV
jgi:hypothetical protein